MASNYAVKSSFRSEKQVPHGSPSSSTSYVRSVGGHGHFSVRASSKIPASRRPVTPNSRLHSDNEYSETGRVRVAVRLRPRTADDLIADADFADCVELQPELKRLKLRKNNWNSESYRFDEVFTESASQRRVYEVVAKPVVESVLNGYNGTVMAYGQTGTGKTYTVGRMGKDDASERGIMVRALEHILSHRSVLDSVEVSYLQLYLESIQDLLAPEKSNITIVEDPKTGEVALPGATIIQIRNLDHFLQLLEIGEGNRHAANTKLNTESSRSHAILMVYIRRSPDRKDKEMNLSKEKNTKRLLDTDGVPIVLKSKLLIVDLAGSERLDKSGSEGHLLEEAKFINLSLSSLGKCINALAEKSPHIPFRDSKLTRILCDSFGGSARTSLIVTIGPSSRYHAETTSTIMFGQRAMKIVNMIKLKEEFDYESLCRKLENQVDRLTAEIDKQHKLRDDDKAQMERMLQETQNSFLEKQEILVTRSEFLEKENTRLELEMKYVLTELNHQKDYNALMCDEVARLDSKKVLADTIQMYEKKIGELAKQLEDEQTRCESAEQQLEVIKKRLSDHQMSIQTKISTYQKALADTTQLYEKKIAELTKQHEDNQKSIQMEGQKEIDILRLKLQEMNQLHGTTISDLQYLTTQYEVLLSEKAKLGEELNDVRQKLLVEQKQRKVTENEMVNLKKIIAENDNNNEDMKSYMKENIGKGSAFGNPLSVSKSNQSKEQCFGPRAAIAKICEEVGFQKILGLLSSEDSDVQIQAVKLVANLAAEDINQGKIVEEGGLDALLRLLQSSQNTTIIRVASGAIANLAMNELNQGLIVSKRGAQLLANIGFKTDDPQTLRMVAGALANLCGNENLHMMLKEDGGIQTLLQMLKLGNSDVIAQVARGIANFAKCESRGILKGYKRGRSLLMEYGVLSWLISNKTNISSSTQRHLELCLCHLAQNEDNTQDFISSGGLKELTRISSESSREDIRNLAKKTLKMNPAFQAEMQTELL